jgi:hypothetical protein
MEREVYSSDAPEILGMGNQTNFGPVVDNAMYRNIAPANFAFA